MTTTSEPGSSLPIAPRSHIAGICRPARLPMRCVFTGCGRLCAPDDLIACEACRVKLDATPFVPQED